MPISDNLRFTDSPSSFTPICDKLCSTVNARSCLGSKNLLARNPSAMLSGPPETASPIFCDLNCSSHDAKLFTCMCGNLCQHPLDEQIEFMDADHDENVES